MPLLKYAALLALASSIALVAACTVVADPAAAPASTTSSASSSSSSTGGPVDPCDAIQLPPCDAPCPADYETQLCGTPCFSKSLRCGDALGKGMVCADDGRWTCETREAPGRFVGCDLTCRSVCSSMDAHGEDQCGSFIGYRWNGHACEGVDCSCVGRDCGSLFPDATTCEASHQSCHADQPSACAGLPCGSSCTEPCSDPECQIVFLTCDAQGACTDRNPVCMPPPCPDGCPPPPDTCTTCQFGGVVCPMPMNVCILGSCVASMSICDAPEP
jgi:hypothetical protein